VTARYILVVLVAFLVFPRPCAEAAAPWVRPEPLKGAIVRGRVLTFQQEKLPDDDRYGRLTAWLAPLAGEGELKRITCPPSNQGPPRWAVGHSACWVGRSFSASAPPRFTEAAIDRYELLHFLRGRLIAGPRPPTEQEILLPFASKSPVDDRLYFAPFCRFQRAAVVVEHDYLSAGRDKVRLFLLTNVGGELIPAGGTKFLSSYTIKMTQEEKENPKWSFTVHSCRARWKPPFFWVDQVWAQEETIAVNFRESFQVLGKGEDYYFVTASGALYVAKQPAKGKQRSLMKVWSDAARPIEALLTDADSNRSFLFLGPPKRGGKPAFFELADRPRLETYDPTSVKPGKEGPERLRRVLHYARVLVAHKKVNAAK
jgi:hypothetical protein